MYEWADNILLTSQATDILDLGYVRGLLVDHRRGHADHSRKIWTVLTFCIWHAIFVEHTLAPTAPRPPDVHAKQNPLRRHPPQPAVEECAAPRAYHSTRSR